MNSLAYIPASDGAANASLMTVTNVRAGGATTIQVNTVANAPAKFYGSYGTPHTFTDPVTGETITVISEATAVDFAGHIDGSNVEIDEIAPGYTDNGNEVGDIVIIRPVTEWANNIFNILNEAHNDDGSLKDDTVVAANIVDETVTPVKRSGGYKQLLYETPGTGSHEITGIGFKPKKIRVTWTPGITATGGSTSGHASNTGDLEGTWTEDGVQWSKCIYNSTRWFTNGNIISLSTTGGSGGITNQASVTSVTDDGCILNWTTAANTQAFMFEFEA